MIDRRLLIVEEQAVCLRLMYRRYAEGASFKTIAQAPPRLNRSQLFVLANLPETFEAAADSVADVVMFEIEDAVPPDQKPQARRNVVEALNDID